MVACLKNVQSQIHINCLAQQLLLGWFKSIYLIPIGKNLSLATVASQKNLS